MAPIVHFSVIDQRVLALRLARFASRIDGVRGDARGELQSAVAELGAVVLTLTGTKTEFHQIEQAPTKQTLQRVVAALEANGPVAEADLPALQNVAACVSEMFRGLKQCRRRPAAASR